VKLEKMQSKNKGIFESLFKVVRRTPGPMVKEKNKKEKKLDGHPKTSHYLKNLSGRRQQADELVRAQKHNERLLLQAAMLAVRKRGLLDIANMLKILLLNPAKEKPLEN